MTIARIIELYLLAFLLPLWVLIGIGDWMCHRASRIEATTGLRESGIHAAMLAEAGIPLLLGLFLEINALVILIMGVGWVLHEATSFWDLRTATGAREITATEQRIHDYLAVIPLMAVSLVAFLHWEQAAALVGLGPESPRFALRWKDPPLPAAYLIGLPAAVLILNGLPYGEELLRCLRWRRAR